jgi:hypothetical protein
MRLVCRLFYRLLLITCAMLRAQTTAVQPYSFTAVATQFDDAGQPKPEYRIFHAVNSAGASVAQDNSPGAGGVRQILHNGLQTIVDPGRRSATSGPLVRLVEAAPVSCVDRFKVAQGVRLAALPAAERIGGVAMDRITLEAPEGQSLVEVLMAPSLGCVILGEKLFRAGRLIRRVEAMDLRLGEPDPSLFEIPSDYTYTKLEREMKR